MNNYLASSVPALTNHLWQSTAFAAAAWLLTILLRKNSARVRYGIWLAASIKFLIPFALLIAVGGLLSKPKQFVAPAVYAAMKVTEQPFADISLAPTASAFQAVTLTQRIAADIPAVLVALWLAGAVVVLIVWRARWRKASICLHDAVPAVQGRELEILRRLEARLRGHLRSPLRLRLSPEPTEPSVYGILRPVLVWPERLSEQLSDEHMGAIMAHELAHARRFDNATAALHMLVEASFWFHPLVWWMERRMIEERERACDEAVVGFGASADAYAEGILKTCRFCVGSALPCVAGVTGADLKKRVVAIMTARMLIQMTWPKKILVSAATLCVLTAPVLLGQLQPSDAPLPTFEVASVKKHPPENGQKEGFMMGGPDVSRFRTSNVTMKMLIATAYSVKEFQVVGGPSWINSERWDIDGKVEDSLAEQLQKLPRQQQESQQALMLRSLLLDRFALEVTRGTKEGTVLALVVAKGGPKLKEVAPPDPQAGLGQPSVPIATRQSSGPAPGQALMMMNGSSGLVTMASNAVPIANLVNELSMQLGQQVVDQTGLNGTYQYRLQFGTQGGLGPDGMPLPPAAERPDSTAPSVFTALQEQLGLKVESTKGQIGTITIDHIEEPSPN
jgi:uncharacterized protein (TIGR03435 family)